MARVVAVAEMLIHRPPEVVFAAFVKPSTIKKFWLKSTSGPLAKDARVAWEFMIKGAREEVEVTEFIADKSIVFLWSSGIQVRLQFDQQKRGSTKWSVVASGFKGPKTSKQAIDTTEGFAIVLCDVKALLETGTSGHMVRDKAALISAAKTDA